MVNHASLALLQLAPREGINSIVFFAVQVGAIIGIFYFLLIRPQKKEQERHRQMIEALKKGDEVVTNGGIMGSIIHAEPDRLTIRTAESTRLVVQRGRIAQLVEPKKDEE